MKCEKCSGNMGSDYTTVTAKREDATVIMHTVPCFTCLSCGWQLVEPEKIAKVEAIADNVKDVVCGDYELDWYQQTNP